MYSVKPRVHPLDTNQNNSFNNFIKPKKGCYSLWERVDDNWVMFPVNTPKKRRV